MKAVARSRTPYSNLRFWALCVGMGAVYFFVYWLASGERPSIVLLTLVLGGSSVANWLGMRSLESGSEKDQQPLEELPREIKERVCRKLEAAGLHDVMVLYDPTADKYPMPLAMGNCVGVPEAVVSGLSPDALDWITVAEARAEAFEPRTSLIGVTIYVIALSVVFGLIYRFEPSMFLAVPAICALFILGPVLYLRRIYLAQIASDLALPSTPEDLAAAKEALSFAYFAQADRRWNDRFMFEKRQVRARGKALGFELERGYRISG